MDAWTIAFIVVTVVAAVGGVKWQRVKSLLKQVAGAITAVSDAVDDDRITKEEMSKIMSEFADVIAAAKKLVGK